MKSLSQSHSAMEPLPLDSIHASLLLDLFRNPDHDVDAIVEFINSDPALTAATLRRCNNASFRGSERTTDIFEAVSRLGFHELYGIVAASIGSCPASSAAQTAIDQDLFQTCQNTFD